MHKFTVFLFIFAIYLQSSECGVTGPGGRSAGYGRPGYVGRRNSYIGAGSQQPTIPTTTAIPTAKELLDRHGISMFALISIMISVIVFSLAFYYVVMCYPFVCGTEKSYNFMDHSSTMTAATSRSIHSIENFPCDSPTSPEQKV